VLGVDAMRKMTQLTVLLLSVAPLSLFAITAEENQAAYEELMKLAIKDRERNAIWLTEQYGNAKAGAEAGDAKAMEELAGIYQIMTIKRKEPSKEANFWLHKSAELGNPDAMLLLGQYYQQGRPSILIEQDFERALHYYDLAIKAGHSVANAFKNSLQEELECDANIANGLPC
jgi:TPR repeat protein